MDNKQQNLKKVYDETAQAIFKLFSQNAVTENEMRFLLNLLDLILVKKEKSDFIKVIQDWLEQNSNSDEDEIIKATLLNIDFSNQTALNHDIGIIKELLLSRKRS